jgi:hypothetical protein
MTDLALDDGRTQGSLGSVVGGLDSLSLQEAPQRISYLQELLAGAHCPGPWRSLAVLDTQLHHPLQRGYKRQPDRLAAFLQSDPVDRAALVAVPVGKSSCCRPNSSAPNSALASGRSAMAVRSRIRCAQHSCRCWVGRWMQGCRKVCPDVSWRGCQHWVCSAGLLHSNGRNPIC